MPVGAKNAYTDWHVDGQAVTTRDRQILDLNQKGSRRAKVVGSKQRVPESDCGSLNLSFRRFLLATSDNVLLLWAAEIA
jgi:hypothetical protein